MLALGRAGHARAPFAAEAQQTPTLRRIGFIATAPRTPVTDAFWDALVAGLRERGWVESRTVAIERRYVEPGDEPAFAAARELVGAGVELLVVSATQTALAAKRATHTVPVVMTIPADPVAVGLVESLARPGANVTGLSFVGTEVAGKQAELLKATVANLTSIAVLVNPMNASHAPRVREVRQAARTLKVRVDIVEASARDAIAPALRHVLHRGSGALLVLTDPVFVREAETIIRFGAEQRLPIVYGLKEAPLAGGLMSYGPDFTDLFRRAAGYVDKILRGADPRDLPIEQASRFELVINVKTAKALGITVPPSLLLRADHVIE